MSGIVDEEQKDLTPIVDEVSGEEIELLPPEIRYPETVDPDKIIREPRRTIFVNGVDVTILVSREMYFDQHGKAITVSLKDHTKAIIREKYASLDAFLSSWNSTDRKELLVAELAEAGILVEALYEAVDKKLDLFDLICHVAFDQPPLTRKERANNVKKRNLRERMTRARTDGNASRFV